MVFPLYRQVVYDKNIMASKKTLIIGASANPARYANIAANRLVSAGHEIVNIGVSRGEAAGTPIHRAGETEENVDTITLYIGPHRQPEYYGYILKTKPRRIIFNPGTENTELRTLAEESGIEATEACTLVMLSTGEF